ncbi:aldo/keto reductase [Tatumella terrea]|uniref:Aldo/keto reductase n=1 Tax=Tatumella terrea TaxID=419007 RepID=A0ABW1VTT4_9GAMM
MKKSLTFSALAAGTKAAGDGRYPEKQAMAALHRAIDCGITTIDTSVLYGQGRAERMTGKVMATRRQEVCLVSEVVSGAANRWLSRRFCQASLKRLQTDHIDFYILHRRYPGLLASAVRNLERLRQEGLIGGWGVADFDVRDIKQLLALPGGENCRINKVMYHCAARGPEYRLLDQCRQAGIHLMAYSPFGGAGDPLLSAPVLEIIARDHRCQPAEIALAWILRQPGMTAIIEADSPVHPGRLARAKTLGLTAADLAAINGVFPPPVIRQPLSRQQ